MLLQRGTFICDILTAVGNTDKEIRYAAGILTAGRRSQCVLPSTSFLHVNLQHNKKSKQFKSIWDFSFNFMIYIPT